MPVLTEAGIDEVATSQKRENVFSQTFRKQPPKMRRVSGQLTEVWSLSRLEPQRGRGPSESKFCEKTHFTQFLNNDMCSLMLSLKVHLILLLV